ncbi:MAG: hypothetical protein AAB074_17960 [Planctomycetota bacterium]
MKRDNLKADLGTLDELAVRCSVPATTLRFWAKKHLLPRAAVHKSRGRNLGRIVLYNTTDFLDAVDLIKSETKAGIPLDEQSRRRGWWRPGPVEFLTSKPLIDLSRLVSPSASKNSRRFHDAIELAARVGAFDSDVRDLTWRIVDGSDGQVMVHFTAGGEEDILKLLREMLEAHQTDMPNAAFTYAVTNKACDDLSATGGLLPRSFEDMTPAEVSRLREEHARIDLKLAHLGAALQNLRKSGLPGSSRNSHKKARTSRKSSS